MIFFLNHKFSGPLIQNLMCVQTLDITVKIKVILTLKVYKFEDFQYQ